jgi:hypothetical protein
MLAARPDLALGRRDAPTGRSMAALSQSPYWAVLCSRGIASRELR